MIHELEDLALYGYCPLRYRYKVLWRLPYREESPEAAYASGVRSAIGRLLHGLADKKAEAAKEAALRAFETSWSRACEGMGWPVEVETGFRVEGHLALYDFLRRLGDDDPLGGGLVTDLSVAEDLVLRDTIDGLVMKGDRSAYRTVCVVQVTDEKSPLASPRYQPLRRQWLLGAVRRQLGFRRGRVAHWVFSPFSGKPPKLYDAYEQRREFASAAKALAHGVRCGVFFQTPHRERCASCWYRRICSASHCGTVERKEIDELSGKTAGVRAVR